MNLSQEAIIIIAAVFGGSFLLMIPIFIFQKKRKNKVKDYFAKNKDKALVQIFGHSPIIDGEKAKNIEHQKGTNLEYIVPLSAGTHTIAATYAASEPSLGRNVNYKTPEITSEIEFEAGKNYTISLYFYSPEERHAYYKGDVGKAVYSQKLDSKNRYLGANANAYIICYEEDEKHCV